MQVNKFVPMVGFCAISLLSSSALADMHELWVVNSATQKCMDATTKDDYGRVQVTECDINLKAEQWVVNQPQKRNIQNAYDGFGNPCLDMAGKTFQVMTKKCDPKLGAQRWYFPPKGEENLIVNSHFKKCLTVTEDNTVVSVICNPKDRSQFWKLVTPEKPVATSSALSGKRICSFLAVDRTPCTESKNECGHPSQCSCPARYTYNPATGHCDLSNLD